MGVLFRTATWLAGFWLALAVVHPTPAPLGGEASQTWSASQLPDATVVHRTRAQVRPGLALGSPAILPAPLPVVHPAAQRSNLVFTADRLRLASRPSSLGARAPPV